MSKLGTLVRLVAARDWAVLRHQWAINTGRTRVLLHGGRPFVYRDLAFPAVCFPEWPDSLDAFLTCSGDRWEFDLMHRWLCPGDSVFDIGASLGQYSCAALHALSGSGTVVAVEADPHIVQRLEEVSTLLCSNALVAVHAAVTDHDGTVNFHIRIDRTVTAMQSLRPGAAQAAASRQITVPARTLRSLQEQFSAHGPPALVKVDIEGAETAALSAAPREWLTEQGPLWIVEIFPQALSLFGSTPPEVAGLFSSASFDLYLLPKHPLGAGAGTELRRLRPAERYDDSLYYNLIAVPRGGRWHDRRLDVDSFLKGAR